MTYWRYLSAIAIIAGCSGDPIDTSEKNSASTPVEMAEEQILVTSVDHLRLRHGPDTESEVVASLREGTPVRWSGEQSEHNVTVTLRGREATGPWYAVTTSSGINGWAFSGGLQPWQPSAGTPYGECLTLFNRAEFSGFYPCLEKISQQHSGPEQAQATSTYLRLRLSNGQTRQWNHILKPGPNYRLYQYLGKLTKPEVHVVKINQQGGSHFLVVHPHSGQAVEVAGIPQPLGMSQSLICLGPKPDEPGSSRLEIIQVDDQQIRSTLQESLHGMALTALTWKKDGAPRIQFRDFEGRPHSFEVVRKGPDQWTLSNTE